MNAKILAGILQPLSTFFREIARYLGRGEAMPNIEIAEHLYESFSEFTVCSCQVFPWIAGRGYAQVCNPPTIARLLVKRNMAERPAGGFSTRLFVPRCYPAPSPCSNAAACYP